MVQVNSEIGRLRQALVHEPGIEIDHMVPAMMAELLFDDILLGESAREEHARFRRVLQLCGVEVLDASDLLAETFELAEARAWIDAVLLADVPAELRRRLLDLDAEALTTALVGGWRREETSPSAGGGIDELFILPPLPNWCFQRDPQIVLGGGVIFSAMAAAARHPEALLSRALFRFHPALRTTPVLFDPHEADRQFFGQERALLEGGDVLILSNEVIAMGLSERTNRSAARYLARALARREGGPRWLLLVEIPRRRAYMHLDTLITPIDREACLVHAPVILGTGAEAARVWQIDLHSDDLLLEPTAPLLERLEALGLPIEPITCGGDDPVAQQREQWTDGANAMAIAPGVITLFDRNRATADELDRRGFAIVDAEDLLLGRAEVDPDAGERTCILIPSHEISRARGGPHCLVHPLRRDPLSV